MKRYKIETEFGVYYTQDRIFANFMNKKPSMWSRFISWLKEIL